MSLGWLVPDLWADSSAMGLPLSVRENWIRTNDELISASPLDVLSSDPNFFTNGPVIIFENFPAKIARDLAVCVISDYERAAICVDFYNHARNGSISTFSNTVRLPHRSCETGTALPKLTGPMLRNLDRHNYFDQSLLAIRSPWCRLGVF